jgi:hypothetical protein
LADPDFAARWDAVLAEQQAEWIAATQARLGPGLDVEEGGGRLTPGRERAGGWDGRKRGLFLRTLARTKRVDAACEAAGMLPQAAHALRGRSPRFAAAWEKALQGAAPSVIDAAYARAVEGWDEPVVQGGQVIAQKRRYSEGLLRDLLKRELGNGADAAAEAPRRVRGTSRRRMPRQVTRDYAEQVAREAGGGFFLPSDEEELNEALLRNLALLDERIAREEREAMEAEWQRWRHGWGARGDAAETGVDREALEEASEAAA